MKYIHIIADTNDADYVEKLTLLKEEDTDLINLLVEKLKNFTPYEGRSKSGTKHIHNSNFPNHDYLRDDLGEKWAQELYDISEEDFDKLCMDYLPFGEHGIHRIESIEMIEVSNIEKLF